MTSENWRDLVNKFKQFWKPGDEIICTRIFRRSNNYCYLCGHSPIEWHHVLLNSVSNETIDVEFRCVINIKKILEEFGSNQKVLFFQKYAEEAKHLNSQYEGTAGILEFNPNTNVIVQLLSRPKELSYKQVKSIIDHTAKFKEGIETDLFFSAIDIYVERKYYVYEGMKEFEQGDNVERIIENSLIETYSEEMSEDYYDNLYEYIETINYPSVDDLTPEGMGSDEIDWDSYDKSS